MKIGIYELSNTQKNFVLAALLKHPWRYSWNEEDSYLRWQGTEQAFGYPTPDFVCNDQTFTSKLIDEYLVSTYPNYTRDNTGNINGWVASCYSSKRKSITAFGKTRLDAVVICLIKRLSYEVKCDLVQFDEHDMEYVIIPDKMKDI